MGKSEEAIKKYERAIELEPKNLMAYFNCAALHEKLGNLDGAIEKIEGALTVDPTNATLKDILVRLKQVRDERTRPPAPPPAPPPTLKLPPL